MKFNSILSLAFVAVTAQAQVISVPASLPVQASVQAPVQAPVQTPVQAPVQAQLANFPELLIGHSNQHICGIFAALLEPIKALDSDNSTELYHIHARIVLALLGLQEIVCTFPGIN
ncbi:hypothetical protein BGX27_005689 [Mortierella sp. AM989]|nr:hypothetical protein BGX27_005689 [Mortierella sp. AM989]